MKRYMKKLILAFILSLLIGGQAQAVISNQINSNATLCNGVITTFQYNFPIVDTANASDLYVYSTTSGVQTLLTTNYSVNTSTQIVTYPVTGSACATGTTITLMRIEPLTQNVAGGNQGGAPSPVVMSMSDKLTMIAQQLQTNINNIGVGTVNPPLVTQWSGANPVYMANGTNVGIGSATPGALLDVYGTIRDLGEIINGNVGIGSTAPGKKLDVIGTIRTTNLAVSGASPIINYVLTATDSSGDTAFKALPSGVGVGTVNAGTSGQIAVYTATTTLGGNAGFVYIGGNMGIGSTAPGAQLDVNGTVRMTGLTLTTSGSSTGYVLVANNIGVGTWMAPVTIGAGGNSGGSGWTVSGNNVYETSGNVGIMSTAPGQQLDVIGTIRTTSLTVSNAATSGYYLTASDSSGDTAWGAVTVSLRVGSTTSTATPSIASGSYDIYEITALATGMTSVTITGSPVEGQMLEIMITDNGNSQSLGWGSISASTVSLPTATTISTPIRVFLQYNGGVWYCVGTA